MTPATRDAQLCPDKETCTQNCVVDGADAEYGATYGVTTSGSDLKLLVFAPSLLQDDYAYKFFQLSNKEYLHRR